MTLTSTKFLALLLQSVDMSSRAVLVILFINFPVGLSVRLAMETVGDLELDEDGTPATPATTIIRASAPASPLPPLNPPSSDPSSPLPVSPSPPVTPIYPRKLGMERDSDLEGRIDSREGVMVGVGIMTLGMLSAWIVSRVLTSIDSDLLMMIFGIITAYFVGHETIMRNQNTSFVRYLQPPLRFVGTIYLNASDMTSAAPQYLTVAIFGSGAIALLNAVLIYAVTMPLKTQDLQIPWCMCLVIGSVLAQPNSKGGGAGRQVSDNFVRSPLKRVIKGEMYFTSIIPTIIQNLGAAQVESLAKGKEEFNGIKFVDLVMSVVRANFTGLAIGVACGMVFLKAIEVLSDRYATRDRILQVFLLLLCSYTAFYSASICVGTSDASSLSVLGAGLILVWRMWVSIISPTDVQSFWKLVGFMGDAFSAFVTGSVLVAVLVGAIKQRSDTGSNTSGWEGWYWVYIVGVIWVGITLVRIIIVVIMQPIIRHMGRDISMAEAALWGWVGTIKGKLGTTMFLFTGINIINDADILGATTEANIKRKFGEALLIIGAAITVLSMAVNGPLTGAIIRWLKVGGRSSGSLLRLGLARRAMRQRLLEMAVATGSAIVPQLCPVTWQHLEDPEGLEQIGFDVYKRSVRELFLSVLESKYMEAGAGKTKMASKIIGGILIESARMARDSSKQSLADWRYLAVNLPNKVGEVSFTLVHFLSCHREAQHVIDNTLLAGFQNSADADYFIRGLNAAWTSVRKESNRSCRIARKVLSNLSDDAIVKSHKMLEARLACETVEQSARYFATISMMQDPEDLGPLLRCLSVDTINTERAKVMEGQGSTRLQHMKTLAMVETEQMAADLDAGELSSDDDDAVALNQLTIRSTLDVNVSIKRDV
jgi:hypothetical protein